MGAQQTIRVLTNEESMKQEVMNFARFYAALNRMPLAVDRDEVKRLLVLQFTDGRTESLREVSRGEYEAMCIEV